MNLYSLWEIPTKFFWRTNNISIERAKNFPSLSNGVYNRCFQLLSLEYFGFSQRNLVFTDEHEWIWYRMYHVQQPIMVSTLYCNWCVKTAATIMQTLSTLCIRCMKIEAIQSSLVQPHFPVISTLLLA